MDGVRLDLDATELSATKGTLKPAESLDRSAPVVGRDAAHPGSEGVRRAITSGAFELKHVETERDASMPVLEKGASYHPDVRPEVLAELRSLELALKPTKANDRSEPLVEKWIHIDTSSKPPRTSVVDELKQKKPVIDALSTLNEHNAKEHIEKFTRPELLTELKAKKADIEELNKHVVQNSKSELQKNVHTNVVDEIKQKRQSIQDFANYAASQQPDNFRAQTHPALVNEILTKRDSIEGLTKLHNQKSGLIDVA